MYPMRYCPWCGRPQQWRYRDRFQNICPHCNRGVDNWMEVCPWCGEDATGRDLIHQALRRVRQRLVVARIKAWNYRVLLRPRVSGVTHRTPKVIEIERDRKSTRLNSSHGYISYAVFCLQKKNQ